MTLLANAPLIPFIAKNIRWLFAGLLLTFLSSFGQTFFISMFGREIRDAFSLSNGDFGFVYMFGTLASAATLVWLGQLADVMRVRVLGGLTIIGLALACITMSLTAGYFSLILAIYVLRLSGQGMMSHVAVVAMGRWFDAFRGRAIAIAALGYPIGEAVFPTLAVLFTLWIGWRAAWMSAAIGLVAIGLPLFLLSLMQRRTPGQSGIEEPPPIDTPGMIHWTRGEALTNPVIWLVAPVVLGPSFIVTGTFFHQTHLVETKGWTLAFWAACYPPYAVVSVVTSVIMGWAIDRWSARQTITFVLLPLGLGLLVLASGTSQWIAVIGMILIGVCSGASVINYGALWPELYGTKNLGGIKALATAGMVFSSALGPGVMGWLIDAGISLDRQFFWIAMYCFAACLLGLALQAKMRQTQPNL